MIHLLIIILKLRLNGIFFLEINGFNAIFRILVPGSSVVEIKWIIVCLGCSFYCLHTESLKNTN